MNASISVRAHESLILPTYAIFFYLAWLDRHPWLLLHLVDLLPDLGQLGPHPLQVLQLLQGHLETRHTLWSVRDRHQEINVYSDVRKG